MKNKKLLLIGGGGHCKSVISSLKKDEYDEIGIIDPNIEVGEKILGIPVVGNDDDLARFMEIGFEYAFISLGSIGNTNLRRRLSERLEALRFNIVNVVDQSANLDKTVKLGHGIFIGKHVVINSDTVIDNYSIINTGAILEHDCKIGEFTHIAPGSVVCGSVTLGNDVHVGANSCIRQCIKIGDEAMVGMGSVVVKNVVRKMKIMGNPAKIFNGGG